MSLDLHKTRQSDHEHVAVGGSFTDSFIEVVSNNSNSSNSSGYVRFVPNCKDGCTYLAGLDDTYLDQWGYLQWNLPSSGSNYYLLEFNYYDDTNTYNTGSNTTPGIQLKQVMTFSAGTSTGLNALASQISSYHASGVSDVVYVIVTNGRIASSSNLYLTMGAHCRSWQHWSVKSSSTTATMHTYCAVGTNVNDIGFLAESIAGPGSGHAPAFCELVIEHDRDTLGHAGYGADLSSGIGKGVDYIDMDGTGSTGQSYSHYFSANSSNWKTVHQDEYVRFTFDTKIGHQARAWDGYIRIRAQECNSNGIAQVTHSNDYQSTDGWTKHEMTFQKTSTNPNLRFQIIAYDGSGSGSGYTATYDKLDIRNFEAYKCGFAPDQQRDQALHKYHINGRNIEESPGPWAMGNPSAFRAFWNTDRNLLDHSSGTTYSLDTTNTSTSSGIMNVWPRNIQSNGGSNSTYGTQGKYNWPEWFGYKLNDTTTSNSWGWISERNNATANTSITRAFGDDTNGVEIDHTKMYMTGVWVRVRRNNGGAAGYAPNRITLFPGTRASAGFPVSVYGIGTGTVNYSNHAFQSWQHTTMAFTDGQRQEWKLLSGFYLPSWFTATQAADWKDSYWGIWANQYELNQANPDDAMSGITGYGLNSNLSAGYVARMTSSVAKLKPYVTVEAYSGTDHWYEFAYPFLIEIDPMNMNDEGDIFFWDFTELIP